MGIKESNPEIKGKSAPLKSNEEKKFFNRTHLIFRTSFINNKYNDNNLIKSLETKSFKYGTKKPDRKKIKDITWAEYLFIYINQLKEKYHISWANELLHILREKNIIILENKFFSDFFYQEYQIKTLPNIINSENEKLESNEINHFGDICNSCALYNTELSFCSENNDHNFCELDILDNLGGSYLELNYGELLPDDPTFQYQLRRDVVKKYIKIFKEHIYDNADHPINQIICIFIKLFTKYIIDKMNNLKNQLEKSIINQEEYDSSVKLLENEITDSLQEFISRMHSAIKLFYSTTIDYRFFEEEKDDLINMITTLFFRTGNLYETLLDLYSLSFKEEFENFQNRLIELKKVKPNKLGIEKKFCLDENTIALQSKLKKNKKIKKDNNKDNVDINDNDKEEKQLNINNENNDKKSKKTSLFQKIAEDNKKNNMTNLYTIKEKEEEENLNHLNSLKVIEGSKNKDDIGQLIYYLEENDNKNNNNINNNDNNSDTVYKNIFLDYNIPIRSKTKLSNTFKDDDYMLEKLSFLEDSKNELYYNPQSQIRNSVNNFNNKVYFFPKIHNKLKNNMLKYEKKKSFFTKKENNESNLPIPYISAINLLKSIKKYKTPFEKIILIAAISDQIMESATSFWKDMEPYIEKDYLFIEADEIINIFLYIIIQSQMPEILLYCKLIKNFTTQFTKSFNISYNYTLLEASLDYINGLKDIREIMQKENGLLDASRSILDISTQRLSRLSSGNIQIYN